MNACPFIRIHSLFKELSKSGDYHFFVYGQEILPLIDVNQIIKSKIFDAIVIQRVNPFSTKIAKKAKQHGIKLIYETDDDFLDMNCPIRHLTIFRVIWQILKSWFLQLMK